MFPYVFFAGDSKDLVPSQLTSFIVKDAGRPPARPLFPGVLTSIPLIARAG
jgi:hypothetical protein